MDIIQLLPDTVANQIAAGEVIERPASVIKELVENSIDAGAQHIKVVVVDAGRTLIRVIDDGKGMSPTDARLAFEHHATSKIRKAEDIFELHTMGFRGEALATIAAVSQVELRTRQKTDDIGTLINIAGSKVEGQDMVSCPVGSSFSVKNIFFNIPARRKFLKSDAAELNNIITIFERIALVYPQVAFTFHVGDVERYNLRAAQLLQRIVDIFGGKMHQDLVPVSVDTTVCKLSGFVGKPEAAKKKGAKQFFFVNGRYMRHPYFHRAVVQAVDRMIPAGEQIPYFLYLDVEPANIDVNVSPTKTDIKFDNEQTIWQIINAAVKDAIGQFADIPVIDFNADNRPDIPVFGDPNFGGDSPKVSVSSSYNPFRNSQAPPKGDFTRQASQSGKGHGAPANWEVFYDAMTPPPATIPPSGGTSLVTEDSGNKKSLPLGGRLLSVTTFSDFFDRGKLEGVTSPLEGGLGGVFQYKATYIMAAVPSGLLVIDQHRAHVRVLYERFMAQLDSHAAPSQKVLFPEILTLSKEEETVLQEINPELLALGFEITPLGGGSFAINGTPASITTASSIRLLQDIVATVDLSADRQGEAAKEAVNSIVAEQLADHTAITYGEILAQEEMEQLVRDLFACKNVNYTPSGKTVLTVIDDIDSRFN